MKNYLFATLHYKNICYVYVLNGKQVAVDIKTGESRPIEHWGNLRQCNWHTGVYFAYEELFKMNRRRFIRKLKKGKTCWVKGKLSEK